MVTRTGRLKKYGAIGAIAFPVMQMVSQALIQIGGAEPPFAASASEIVSFFAARNPTLFSIGGYISLLSIVAFLWFLGTLWEELRAAEGGGGLLSVVAVASGFVAVSTITSPGGWPLAVFRIDEGLDPQLARLLFDQGNMNFANYWVALGSMVLAVGLLARQSQRLPAWLGWGSIALAVGLFAARAVWTSAMAFAPYVLFYLWLIAFGIYVLRRERQLGQ
ncbi:MAG: hypothetical protein RRC07_02820 [Anaerolineae bacterium]|nr:hypothetical protein [Anaerolineae bacterium]